MDTSTYSIDKNTNESTKFSSVRLSSGEVADIVNTSTASSAESALREATRAGRFSPVMATANDTVGVEIKPDGSAVILVEAVAPPIVTITITDTANSWS